MRRRGEKIDISPKTYTLTDRLTNEPMAEVEVMRGRIMEFKPREGYEKLMQRERAEHLPFEHILASYRNVVASEQNKSDEEGEDMEQQKINGEEVEVEKDVALLHAEGEIKKIEPDQRLVFGWAYVTHDKTGAVNVDKSGDFVDAVEEIEKSAYDFVLRSRNGDANHDSKVVSTLVESIVFTPEKIEKMGLDAGSVPLGWWVGFKINDDNAWNLVKSGELRSFSIGGRGTRKKVEE